MTGRSGARHCSRCSRSVKGADLVVIDGSKLFHHECFVQRGEMHNPVHEFLARHFPAGFCARCLTRRLRLTHEQVRRLVKASRSRRRAVVLLGARCAGCWRSRLTLQARL